MPQAPETTEESAPRGGPRPRRRPARAGPGAVDRRRADLHRAGVAGARVAGAGRGGPEARQGSGAARGLVGALRGSGPLRPRPGPALSRGSAAAVLPRRRVGARSHGQPRHRLAAPPLDGRAGDPAPPPHPERAWLTVTPDPGVVEVNLPPCARPGDVSRALGGDLPRRRGRRAVRRALPLQRRGDRLGRRRADHPGRSVAGGEPVLRPPLAPARQCSATCNRHPSLSYAFAGECVGSASQGPRPDEGVRERFEELAVSLDRLESRGTDR